LVKQSEAICVLVVKFSSQLFQIHPNVTDRLPLKFHTGNQYDSVGGIFSRSELDSDWSRARPFFLAFRKFI